MAFVKLDCGLLDSTLWVKRDDREIFITALLMAEPHELTEKTPQIEVRSLNETGFYAPPGWYGFVPAAGIGIIRRAQISEEDGLNALEALGSVDPESRSPEFDGRRMIRINGGYLILNYQKYRDRDYTAAERSRRYRLRKSQRDDVVSHRDITQGEEEVEVKAEVENTTTTSRKNVPFSDILNLYHEKLPELPRIVKLTDSRKGYIRQRWLQDLGDLEEWGKYFDIVRKSSFLMGKSKPTKERPPFRADLIWLCKPENICKVIEGKYHG